MVRTADGDDRKKRRRGRRGGRRNWRGREGDEGVSARCPKDRHLKRRNIKRRAMRASRATVSTRLAPGQGSQPDMPYEIHSRPGMDEPFRSGRRRPKRRRHHAEAPAVAVAAALPRSRAAADADASPLDGAGARARVQRDSAPASDGDTRAAPGAGAQRRRPHRSLLRREDASKPRPHRLVGEASARRRHKAELMPKRRACPVDRDARGSGRPLRAERDRACAISLSALYDDAARSAAIRSAGPARRRQHLAEDADARPRRRRGRRALRQGHRARTWRRSSRSGMAGRAGSIRCRSFARCDELTDDDMVRVQRAYLIEPAGAEPVGRDCCCTPSCRTRSSTTPTPTPC